MFCESFLEYVDRHPLLQRAIISRYHDDGDDEDDDNDDDDDDDHHQNYDSDKQPSCGSPTLSPSPLSVTVFSPQKGENSLQEQPFEKYCHSSFSFSKL